MGIMEAIEALVAGALRDRVDPRALRGLRNCIATGTRPPATGGPAPPALRRRISAAQERPRLLQPGAAARDPGRPPATGPARSGNPRRKHEQRS
jgi:hypothetical protein